MSRVSEFKPLLETLDALHSAGMPIFPLVTMLLMLAALVGACLLAPRGEDAGLLAIAALMVAAAFAAVRNTALAALALAVPLASRRSGRGAHAPARGRPGGRAGHGHTFRAVIDVSRASGRRGARRDRAGVARGRGVRHAARGGRMSGGRRRLYGRAWSTGQRARRIQLGRLPPLARGAGLESLHRQPFRDDLSARGAARLSRFSPRRRRRRTGPRRLSTRLRNGGNRLVALSLHAAADGLAAGLSRSGRGTVRPRRFTRRPYRRSPGASR
jgi:hypothetical protein